MKNILIATDFSREAYCALFYTIRLFMQETAKFHIVNFYGDSIQSSIYSLVNEEESVRTASLKEASETGCEETLHQVVRDSGLSPELFELHSSSLEIAEGIEEKLIQNKIDLLVMGTKQHKGLRETVFGTNTTRIIDKAISCPLLVIPRQLEYSRPGHIAFASELTRRFRFHSLRLLNEIASANKASISVIYEGEEGSLSREQWNNFNDLKVLMDDTPVHLEYFSSHTEISRSIAEFVKTRMVNMLCMIYYRHQLTETIFREPVIKNLDRHLSFPFLILPEVD